MPGEISRIRRDLIRKRYVIFVPERAKRPHNGGASKGCPFCPELIDTECLTPILTWKDWEGGPWNTKVVPNKYALLHIEGKRDLIRDGIFRDMNGLGVAEVIIPTIKHKGWYEVTRTELYQGLWAAKQRIVSLKGWKEKTTTDEESVLEYIEVFLNSGINGRESIGHAHLQLTGLPFLPVLVKPTLENCDEYYDKEGDCPFCIHRKQELSDAQPRLVGQNDEFFAVVDYAGEYPYQTAIYPKEHRPSFSSCGDKVMKLLADIIVETLYRLAEGIGKPDFNMMLVDSPLKERGFDKCFHFHFTITPRGITEAAGFTLGTGIAVNEYLPEEAATILRGVKLQ